MKKVLILDDRPNRKTNHMNEIALKKLIDLEKRGCLKMITGEGLDKDHLQCFEDFSLIAIHYSWMNENRLIDEIDHYTQSNDKLLIEFSGGIGQMLLLNDFKKLRINSADFYTDGLSSFIEKYVANEIEQPILQFLYGESWRLPIYMKYRHYIWKGNLDNDQSYDKFESNFETYIEGFNDASLNEAINNEICKIKATSKNKAI